MHSLRTEHEPTPGATNESTDSQWVHLSAESCGDGGDIEGSVALARAVIAKTPAAIEKLRQLFYPQIERAALRLLYRLNNRLIERDELTHVMWIFIANGQRLRKDGSFSEVAHPLLEWSSGPKRSLKRYIGFRLREYRRELPRMLTRREQTENVANETPFIDTYAEERERFRECWACFSETDKRVFDAVLIQGRSQSEVAQLLSESPATVSRRITRIRDAFRALAQEGRVANVSR
jgi:RNA polymerase sigma factor (sigma-70 family)